MRRLTEHKVNPVNDRLAVIVADDPGAGGAHHRYDITGYDESANPSTPEYDEIVPGVTILFQNGPIDDVGVNGVTHEALLAIVADRLRSFQAGPYSCKENACALTHIEEALHWLHWRTIKRTQRGVEGTHTV